MRVQEFLNLDRLVMSLIEMANTIDGLILKHYNLTDIQREFFVELKNVIEKYKPELIKEGEVTSE